MQRKRLFSKFGNFSLVMRFFTSRQNCFFSVALQYHSNDTFEGNGLNLKQLFSTAKLVQPLEIAYSYEQGRGGGIY